MREIITLTQLSKILGKSKITCWRYWAKDKILPPPIKINGRCLGWRESTITEWLNANEVK